MVKKVWGCFFSPCGNVKKIVMTVGRQLAAEAGVPYEEYDFTLSKKREEEIFFEPEDFVILGSPVYAGRVPNKIMPFIKERIHGGGAVGIPLVSFGNRSYDDALSELYLMMKENGFRTIAAGAVVAEHSFADCLAPGRPDERDRCELKEFADRVWEKLNREGSLLQTVPGAIPPVNYYTPLKEDGTPAKFLKAVPKTRLELCKKCGVCADVCPMGSVDPVHPELTRGVCIKCQACIRYCAQGARYFDDADFLSHRQMLIENYGDRKESIYLV